MPTSTPSARYGHTLSLVSAPSTPGRGSEDRQDLLLLLFGGDAGGKWLSRNEYRALLYNDVWLLHLVFSLDEGDANGTGRGQTILSSAWRQVHPVPLDRARGTVLEGRGAEPVARQAHSAFVSNGCLVSPCSRSLVLFPACILFPQINDKHVPIDCFWWLQRPEVSQRSMETLSRIG